MDQPTAEEALRRLEPFVGEWTMRAHANTWEGRGTASFEWHPGRAHLVQRGTVDHPDAPNTLAMIGCDGAEGTYTQLYSDDRGVCRVYDMTFDGTTWTLRPNQCFSGSYDGWLWRYEGACGSCACHVERRCHDGYRRTSAGWRR